MGIKKHISVREWLGTECPANALGLDSSSLESAPRGHKTGTIHGQVVIPFFTEVIEHLIVRTLTLSPASA